MFIFDLGSARIGKGVRVYRVGVTKFEIAPKLLLRSPYDLIVDAFACEVMLMEMVTGRKPFGW